MGPSGTGKSHLAQAFGHAAIRTGYDVLVTTQSKMLNRLQAARATNSYDRHFAKLAAVDLLFIDDFGLQSHKSHKGGSSLKSCWLFTPVNPISLS